MKKIFLLILPLLLFSGYANAKKPQLAKSVWFLMEQQENLKKQPNDSVIVTCQIEDRTISYAPRPWIVLTIKNNSERTIYVDMQNSFVIPNEELYPLFTNTTTVSTQGNTSIGGVNIGMVGIGSASSEYNSTVRQEQRFLIIPGESKKVLEMPIVKYWGTTPWKLNNNGGIIRTFSDKSVRDDNRYFILIQQNFINKGELLSYIDSNNPFNLDFRICYSFNEDMKPGFVDKTVYFTKYVIGSSDFGLWREKDYEFAKKLFPNLDSFSNALNNMVLRLWEGSSWYR